MDIRGDWEVDDFESLFSSIRGPYAYFYWACMPADKVDPIVRSQIQSKFWSTDSVPSRLEHSFYERIPHEGRLRVASIHFASPGWVEVTAFSAALLLLGKAVNEWIKAMDSGFDLLKKVQDFFEKRQLRKVPPRFSLSDIDGATVDEARELCFEVGKSLSFEDRAVESLIDLAGNPISALRLLIRLSVDVRNVHKLKQSGRLTLPEAPEQRPTPEVNNEDDTKA